MKKTFIAIFVLATALFLCACEFSLNFGDDLPLFRDDGANAFIPEGGGTMLNLPDASDPSISDIIGGLIPGSVGEWPDNELTKMLPKPDIKIATARTEGDTFFAMFSDTNAQQVKAYAEKVKAAGFTLDAEVQDENVMDISIYSYTASNQSGYTVTVAFYAGNGSVSLSKQDDD